MLKWKNLVLMIKMITCTLCFIGGQVALGRDALRLQEQHFNVRHDLLFRDLFAQRLIKSGYLSQDIQQFHLPWNPEFEDLLSACNERVQSIAECDRLAKELLPSDLVEHSMRIDFDHVEIPIKEKPTFIILPGFIAEIAEVVPYRELFERDSSLKRHWLHTLKDASDEDKFISQYSLMEGRDVKRHFSEILVAASIEADDGHELAHFYAFTPRIGSLETIGLLQDNVERILKYIDQLDHLISLKGPIYFIGYSRGANVGLELISRLPQLREHPLHRWAQNVAGFITINGPVFGTPLTDQNFGLPHSIKDLQDIGEGLISCRPDDGAWQRFDKIRKNTIHWRQSIHRLSNLSSLILPPIELGWESIRPGFIDFGYGFDIINKILFKDLFHLARPIRNYCLNIDRFKRFIEAIYQGSQEMSTQRMIEWFASHTLPIDLDYIAVSATMMNASTKEHVYEEGKNTRSYQPGSADLQLTRSNFYQLFRATGLQLNDGLVPTHRSVFLPEFHRRLNPNQEPYETRQVGIFWQHHLGLAIPNGVPMANKTTNPFPRQEFLETLVQFIQLRAQEK